MVAPLLLPKDAARRAYRALVWRRPIRLRVTYKSGRVQHIRAKKFTITRDGARVTNAEWLAAWPDPMLLGVDNIESIFEV